MSSLSTAIGVTACVPSMAEASNCPVSPAAGPAWPRVRGPSPQGRPSAINEPISASFCACERPDMSGPTDMNRKIQICRLPASPFRAGDGKLTFNGECHSLRLVLIRERSVSYLVAAILSVALVRLAMVCACPRRTLAADGANANSDGE